MSNELPASFSFRTAAALIGEDDVGEKDFFFSSFFSNYKDNGLERKTSST